MTRNKDKPLPVAVTGKKSNLFTRRLCEVICTRVAAGEKLVDICKTKAYPTVAEVIQWYMYPDEAARPGFVESFNKAQRISWEIMAHQLLEIADDSKITYVTKIVKGKRIKMVDTDKIIRDRLKIETRKYVLSKRMPEIFGDSIKVEHTGSIDLVARLAAGRVRVEQNASEERVAARLEGVVYDTDDVKHIEGAK